MSRSAPLTTSPSIGKPANPKTSKARPASLFRTEDARRHDENAIGDTGKNQGIGDREQRRGVDQDHVIIVPGGVDEFAKRGRSRAIPLGFHNPRPAASKLRFSTGVG